jgi:hypothetical protein
MINEEETREYFESRRGDMSEWSAEPSRANVRRGGSVVFSLRFGRDQLELLRQRAEASGATISEFIRRAALRDAIESRPIVYYAIQGEQSAYRYFVSTEPNSGDDQFTKTLPVVTATASGKPV